LKFQILILQYLGLFQIKLSFQFNLRVQNVSKRDLKLWAVTSNIRHEENKG
jgi:hypothetical protein